MNELSLSSMVFPTRNFIKFNSWKQTSENIELILNVSTYCCYIYVEDDKITIKTHSGLEWTCKLYNKIIQKSSTAFLKSGLLTVKLKKQHEFEWLFYKMTDNPPLISRRIFEEFSDCDDSDQEEVSKNPNTLLLPSVNYNSTLTECVDMEMDDLQDSVVGENSSVMKISNPSEYFYKSVTLTLLEVSKKTITIFLFAVGIEKESVEVVFGRKCMVLVFYSCDSQLRKNRNNRSAEEQVFSITISLEDDILEEQCESKILPINSIDYVIEMLLVKKELKMWNAGSVAMTEDSHIQQIQTDIYESKNSFSPTILSTNEEESVFVATNTAKPTCTVLPVTPIYCNDETIYSQPTGRSAQAVSSMFYRTSLYQQSQGFVGLENIGNTCYMNCVVQVLANTLELKNYFLTEMYKTELNVNNLYEKGELASEFARVVSTLWGTPTSSFSLKKLKTLICKRNNRFDGMWMHDAEEFMQALLDGLHEDLNGIVEKSPDNSNMQTVAAAQHKTSNGSFIYDLFQGQYMSRLTCTTCGKASVTFEPFNAIQVPIPKKKRLITVKLMPMLPSLRPLEFRLQIGINATVRSLLLLMCQINKNLRISDLRVFKVKKNKVDKKLTLECQIPASSKTLLVCEVMSQDMIGKPVVEVLIQQKTVIPIKSCIRKKCQTCQKDNLKSKRCSRCYKVSYCDQVCQKKDWPQHKQDCIREDDSVGFPFVISLPQSMVTYQKIVKMAAEYARYSVHVFQPPMEGSQSSSKLPGSDGSGDHHHHSVSHSMKDVDAVDNLNHSLETNVKMSPVEENKTNPVEAKPIRQVLATQQDPQIFTNPPFMLCFPPSSSTYDFVGKRNVHCFTDEDINSIELSQTKELFVVWKNSIDKKSDNYVVVESKSLECDIFTPQDRMENTSVIQLADCFDLFTEPEVLESTPSWDCSMCKMKRQATKEISISRLPQILIVHLKRFSFDGQKIEDYVHFPIRGLDMSPYYKGGATGPKEFPSAYRAEESKNQNFSSTYDLYGTVNHHGNTVYGHYTSFAKCFGDLEHRPICWRLFDDSHVTECNESDVLTESAYILFYKRRKNFQRSKVDHHLIGLSMSQEFSCDKKDVLDDNFHPSPIFPKVFSPNYDLNTSQPSQLDCLKTVSLISYKASATENAAIQPQDNLATLSFCKSDFEYLAPPSNIEELNMISTPKMVSSYSTGCSFSPTYDLQAASTDDLNNNYLDA